MKPPLEERVFLVNKLIFSIFDRVCEGTMETYVAQHCSENLYFIHT